MTKNPGGGNFFVRRRYVRRLLKVCNSERCFCFLCIFRFNIYKLRLCYVCVRLRLRPCLSLHLPPSQWQLQYLPFSLCGCLSLLCCSKPLSTYAIYVYERRHVCVHHGSQIVRFPGYGNSELASFKRNKSKHKKHKLSQQSILTEGGLEFRAANQSNQCSVYCK